MEVDNGHYVYIYRNQNNDKVRYVGRGKKATRAVQHQNKSHNKNLEDWLQKNKYKLEISGPYGDNETAIAVESALISALNPDFNMRKESTQYSFRPLGVPNKYVSRLQKEPLGLNELFKNNTQRILLVKVTDKKLRDERVGYQLDNPPNDSDIVARVEKYWLLGSSEYREQWICNRNESPTLLLGVTGSPGNQIIVASLEIDTKSWGSVIESEKMKNAISVPLKNRENLDKYSLRGYRLDKGANIKFKQYKKGQYILIDKNERL